MTTLFQRFRRDERGATAIEYGILAALIAVAIIGAVTLLGGNLSTLFNTIAGRISTTNTTAAGTGTGTN